MLLLSLGKEFSLQSFAFVIEYVLSKYSLLSLAPLTLCSHLLLGTLCQVSSIHAIFKGAQVHKAHRVLYSCICYTTDIPYSQLSYPWAITKGAAICNWSLCLISRSRS